MKKSHIVAIVVILAAIAIIVRTAGSSSTYATFDEAFQLASHGNTNSIHVGGELKKNAAGEIVGLEPGSDKVSFSFLLVDENGKEQKVFYGEPMPPDLTRSEKIVVIGRYQNDLFVAGKILLKCPSKYQEKKLNAAL